MDTNKNLVNKILKQKQIKHIERNKSRENRRKIQKLFLPINYILGKTIDKIVGIMKKDSSNLKIAIRSTNKLKNKLNTEKGETTTLDKNGEYKLECGQYKAYYICQTNRRLDIRINEHINRPSTWAFGKHIRESGQSSNILH